MPDRKLQDRFCRVLREEFRVRPGERIGVAVSGGADSVALLLLLAEAREKLGLVPSVVHFNHKLRGRASEADFRFVARLASRLGFELHQTSERIASRAKKERRNLEEAGRNARYLYFQSLVELGLLTRIAVAHTADDQAETVLAHLFRGTGVAGLGGIHPVRGPIFRPLLGFRREELRRYLRSARQPWREDRTNRDTRRTRARIRQTLLPLLEKKFQPRIVPHLAALADLARQDEAFLDSLAEARWKELSSNPGEESRLPLGGAGGEPARAILTRIIRRIVKSLKPSAGELSSRHVAAILRLAEQGENRGALPLPGGVRVLLARPDLVFSKVPKAKRALAAYSHPLDLSLPIEHVPVPQLRCAIRFRVIDWPAKRGQTSISGAVLDLERLRAPLVLRNWRAGDRLAPAGRGKAHKLKRFFNEKRISLPDRGVWPVLTCGGVPVWARGLPAAAEFAAGNGTRKGLLITEDSLGNPERGKPG